LGDEDFSNISFSVMDKQALALNILPIDILVILQTHANCLKFFSHPNNKFEGGILSISNCPPSTWFPDVGHLGN
jgi:hypothetical protein